ncbi:MAG: hypothetical protein WC785_10780 [Tatlockia sp.]
MKNYALASLTCLCFLTLVANPGMAFAYLDPGTGSILLQGLIGGITAGLVFLRLYWQRLLQFLGIKKQPVTDKAKD